MNGPQMNTYTISRYGQTWELSVEDDIMETHYKKGELCEYHMLDWMMKNIPEGGIWIDAGANIGNHTIPFAFKADKVIAFEPIPQNFRTLQFNLLKYSIANGRSLPVATLMIGVGDKRTVMNAKLGGTGQNCQWILGEDGPESGIHVRTIDSIIPSDEDVRVIKLDVEGMERPALAGAWKTITRCKPELFIEIWDDGVLVDIAAGLGGIGYTLIERWNVAPTYHFSASGRYPVTYTPPKP